MTSTLYIYSFNIQQDVIKDSLNPSMEGTVIGWKKEIHVLSVPGASGMDRNAVHCVERVVPLIITAASYRRLTTHEMLPQVLYKRRLTESLQGHSCLPFRKDWKAGHAGLWGQAMRAGSLILHNL